MRAFNSIPCRPHFRAGAIEAYEWEIPQPDRTVEQVARELSGPDGLMIQGVGLFRVPTDKHTHLFISPPVLLHPEGLSTGNRLAVLTMAGANWSEYLPQPESDWLLKAADIPYDTIQELSSDYGLGAIRGDRAALEIVAGSVVEVFQQSEVKGTVATVGIWMAPNLDKSKSKIGYRILDRGQVISRGVVLGADLSWQDEENFSVGKTNIEVAQGAVIQCIASYCGHAHHVQWRADPSVFQNSRAALLTQAVAMETMQSFLLPEPNAKGRVSTDFEDAIAWLIWALGFSTVSFGANAKAQDAFDVVAVSPAGDFLVIECTTGLIRAESKLSKLVARAVAFKAVLEKSNLRNIRVLPVMVSSLTREQLKADIGAADEAKVLVLAREDIDEGKNDLLRLPNADQLFERAWQGVQDRANAMGRQLPLIAQA
jgi:Holliday junction resolvase